MLTIFFGKNQKRKTKMEVAEDRFSEKAKSDYSLVLKAQSGDQKAFARLLAMYKGSVFCMINRMVKTMTMQRI